MAPRLCAPNESLIMKPLGMRHPQTLVSLTIIRSRGEFAANSRIRSAAMFTVRLTSEGAAFTLDHFAYPHRALRADIISSLSSAIPRSAALISAVPGVPKGHFRRLLASGDPLPPADIQLINRARPDLRTIPLQIGRLALQSAADEMAIPIADADAPVLERARRAGDHAQAVWAAYLLSVCSAADRVNLASAWQAWSALQRARPIPF